MACAGETKANNRDASMNQNPFWQYSLSVYQRPTVAELCLRLQDEFQADVNMLLCAAWLSSIGQPLTEGLLYQLSADSYDWQQNCLGPLRQARRFLKPRAAADTYQAIKRLELEVEAMQQQKIYQRLKHLPLAAANESLLANNLKVYTQVLAGADDVVLSALVAQLCEAITTPAALG